VVRAQGGRVFIAGATGGAAFTAAFRARTGELLWQERSNEPWVGTVQVQGGRLIELGGRSLRARAVSTGAMLWETAPPSDLSTTQFLTAMDAGVYGIFVAGVRIRDSAEADIVVRAYDLDGALLWTDQAARSPNSGVSDIVLQGKRLYVVGYAAAPQNRLNTDFLIRAYRVGEDPRLKAPPLKANRS
jgi:outer membrane protein assembly factor BamB